MFCMSNELRGGNENAFDALLYCVRHGVMISGEVAKWLVEENDYDVADGFEDYEFADRWSIPKYYILQFDEEYYRVWEQIGLTEMQPNEWYDQVPERVHMKRKVINVWMSEEEIEGYPYLLD